MSDFSIIDIPKSGRGRPGNQRAIRIMEALAGLPDGKCLSVPVNGNLRSLRQSLYFHARLRGKKITVSKADDQTLLVTNKL